MKKYFGGIFAIALALSFSAFTSPKKEKVFGDIFFIFDGTGDYLSATAMANPANWDHFTGTTSTECTSNNTTEAQGCVIKVSDDFYESDGEGGYRLKTGAGAPTIAVVENSLPTDNRKIVVIEPSVGLTAVTNKRENF